MSIFHYPSAVLCGILIITETSGTPKLFNSFSLRNPTESTLVLICLYLMTKAFLIDRSPSSRRTETT